MSATYQRVITGTVHCRVCNGQGGDPSCKCKGRGEFYVFGHRRVDAQTIEARRAFGFISQTHNHSKDKLDALRSKLAS